MSSFSSALEYQSVPQSVFEQMRRSLSCLLSREQSHLSEQDFDGGRLPIESNFEKFALFSTGAVRFLLLAQPDRINNYQVCVCTTSWVVI